MEGDDVEPFLVRAVAPNKPKEKTHLEFKKGQEITVEKISKEGDMYFGFYGKKEGWFADYFVQKIEGTPEVRKGAMVKKAPPPKKTSSAPQTASNGSGAATSSGTLKLSKKEEAEQKKQEKAAQLEQQKKERADKKAEEIRKKKEGKGSKSSKKKTSSARLSKKIAAEEPSDEKLIPAIIESTVAYLEQPERLKLEGLFRVSGSLNDVKQIKADFLKGKKVDLSKVHDPHTVAGVLKIFFRESKDPLLTFELYDCWVAAIATPQAGDRVASVRQVIDLLPAANRRILTRLMGLLTKVASYEKVNLMTVNNIAIVFAPTLLRPPGDQIDIAIQDSSYANHLIKFMIEEYEPLFGEKRPPPASPTANNPRKEPVAARPTTPSPTNPPGNKPAPVVPQEDDFDKRIRRGSLLLARGSFIGGHNSFQELEEKMMAEHDEEEDVSIDLSSDDIEGEPESEGEDSQPSGDSGTESESEEASGVMSMEEMMDKILEGHVNEVDDYLATLAPDIAASTKKDLLARIDALMQSDDFKD